MQSIHLEQKLELAQKAFEDYDFEVACDDAAEWDTSDPNDITRIVYLSEGEHDETFRANFHVRFDESGRISDVYVLDMSSGSLSTGA